MGWGGRGFDGLGVALSERCDGQPVPAFIKRQFETAGLQTAGAGQSLKVSVDEPCAVWLL